MGGSIEKVDICKIKFYICRVVLNPQLGLIDSNRRVSSDMEPQSSHHHRSNKWIFGKRKRWYAYESLIIVLISHK